MIENFTTNYPEYQAIAKFYGEGCAKRSGVRLINHIREGLVVLEILQASEATKRAFCLHPMVQTDDLLKQTWEDGYFKLEGNTTLEVVALAFEYRSVANSSLSFMELESASQIRLSPMSEVNTMLIADKIQNRKDFDIHHKSSHPRASQLDLYFATWFERLNIHDSFYQSCLRGIEDTLYKGLK